MNHKFSVLMSVYYKENPKNFELALKSILVEQTKTPNEFILVCDGPLSPQLDVVVNRYKKRFQDIFKVYRLETNQGLGKALNFGLTKCTYDLVARADSDDICDKERFYFQTHYLTENPNISIISSHIDEFDNDYTQPKNRKELPLTQDELAKMAKFRNPLNHMAVMFRKNDIIEIGSYRHIPYVEDYELWVRAIIRGKKIANIDKVLVHARVGNGMVGRRGNRAYINSWKILSSEMLQHGMINKLEYCRNMLAVRGFVYMPVRLKQAVYNLVLRKELR